MSLLHGVADFRELETRITALATEKERGDAFEVFAEAYLATQRLVQADEVWPLESVPPSLRRSHGLGSGADMGVDGVYRDNVGVLAAYQVKFRTGRPSLTWRELSTFVALGDRFERRVLITNSCDLPSPLDERAGFFCIRGSDLDRLSAVELAAIATWMDGAPVRPHAKEPKPHQHDALAAISDGLAAYDRVTSVMACGTGKTLVALWVAQQRNARTVLVLVPSLTLIRQTLHEWVRESSWTRFACLCVCSDPTVGVGADAWNMVQSDLDFPVTTDADEVAEWFARPYDGVRIVFSTYQSATVVADGVTGLAPFDLGIFDEAHKTAGREGSRFAFALRDRNLAIRKRLFLTATPRHFDLAHRDKQGDCQLVYSMDVVEDYGPTVYTLPFAEAAQRGLICAYKVIISVVTSETVNAELLRHGEVVVAGEVVRARQVASQIALAEAVRKYKTQRIFTFHASVASAQSFVSGTGEGVGVHLAGFNVFHVNGNMRASERESALRGFGAADRALVSNARCLTEGVDVPAVDMVAFISPRKSKVDIVQATGRAMRKDPRNPDKAIGYVLVPLFVEVATGETIEAALHRSGFEDVWNVLQAMQEQDGVLADVIRRMREDRGRTGGFDDTALRQRVECLAIEIPLDELRSSIATECVERLGSSWDEWFGRLARFKEEFGHCTVPASRGRHQPLAGWAAAQQVRRDAGTLSAERIARLDQLGFEWLARWAGRQRALGHREPRTEWDEHYEMLHAYKAEHGNCKVPPGHKKDRRLLPWMSAQRTNRKKGTLSAERIARLDQLGFQWDLREAAWETMYAELSAFKLLAGDCDVPAGLAEYQRLAIWVATQRTSRKKEILSVERIGRLDQLGFQWDLHEAAWETMYAELSAFKLLAGDCDVPVGLTEYQRLASWVATQRATGRRGSLPSDRVTRLNEIGFRWWG